MVSSSAIPPAVAIVVPTYNRLVYLKEMVASVFAQTFANWALIVVDDGSTDQTVSWLRSLGDARVTVVPEEHTGNRSRLRNIGISLATADWIAFLDSDDLWRSDKLARQLGQLEMNPTRRWSCTAVRFIDERGATIPQRGGTPYHTKSGWILEELLTFDAAVATPSLVVHRSLLDASGGFDEDVLLGEDYELALRLAEHSQIHAMEGEFTIVRHHDGRTSSRTRVSELHRGTELVFRKVVRMTSRQRVRDICSRQIALQLISRARALSREGERIAALRSAGRAVLEQPFLRETWRAAVGATLRLFNLRAGPD